MTEIWQVGFCRRAIETIFNPPPLDKAPIIWLPRLKSYCFIADPFGVVENDRLTIFVEYYDYRTRCGDIRYYQYNDSNELIDQGIALSCPFHLSYPVILKDGGDYYMLPEAHKSGALTLYKAETFPHKWCEVAVLLDQPAIDATPVFFAQKWWLFYALPGDEGRAMNELHLAYADQLTGPWQTHPLNPVLTGRHISRPGGLPFIINERLYLPVQDCSTTYGGGLNLIIIDQLSPEGFSAHLCHSMTAEGLNPDFKDGCHTLSWARSDTQNVLMIDVKHDYHSPMVHWVRLVHRFKLWKAKT